MKKTRSIISIIICVLLLLSILSSCAKSNDESSTKDVEKSDTLKTSEVERTEPLTISWLCSNGSTSVYDFENMAWCQEILKKANVKLDMELIDSSVYSSTVMPRLAAGVDLPDVVFIPGRDNDMSYINSGIFIELTDLYDKYGKNLEQRFADNPTIKSQITTPDGKIFYVPVINMSVDYLTALILNLRWLDELGLQKPTTTDEYYNLLKSLQGHDLNGNGKDDEIPLFLRANTLQLFGSLWGLDLSRGYMVENDGKVRCSYASDRYKNFLEYWSKVYKEGLLYNEFATSTLDIQNNLFSQDRIGTILHNHNNCLGYSQRINPEFDLETDKLIMSPIDPIVGPYGDRFFWGNDPMNAFYGITKDCKNPEETFKFLDYLFSKEANDLLYFGIEGIDYVMDGDKMVLDLQKRTKDNYANKMGNNFGGFPRILLAIHRDLAYTPEIADNNKRLREFYRLPIVFSFFLEDELDIVQAYEADLKTYWDEMFLAFITGAKDIKEFDSYVGTLETMHMSDMEAVYQAKSNRMSK